MVFRKGTQFLANADERECMLSKNWQKDTYNSESIALYSSFQAREFPVGGRIQSLIFDLFSRETLFHEDFFHAGQVIALKFYRISFYCTAACKL